MLFLFVPIAAGFSIALVARQPSSVIAISLLSVLCTLIILIALGKEGTLCAVLAFPIILAGLAIGLGLGLLARKFFTILSANQNMIFGVVILVVPALLIGGERIETPTLRPARIEVVRNSLEINESPEHVWNRILSIDEIHASKPFLMYVGLPIPERCELRGQGVGAKRTCYFNVGYIEETVTGWNPPYYMSLSVDRTHMPGRHWLGFENAEYRMSAHPGGVTLTRTTTMSSHLHPSWYWRRFERMGVEAEHRYILADVASRGSR